MPEERPKCPFCLSSQDVFPVSRIYVAGITKPSHRTPADWAILKAVYQDLIDAGVRSSFVSGYFNPPAIDKETTHPFHPDMGLAFILTPLVILAGNMYGGNIPWWPAPLGTAAIAALIYLFTRRGWIARYHTGISDEYRKGLRGEEEMAHWQRMYFCSHDRQIFEGKDPGDLPDGLDQPDVEFYRLEV